MVGKTNGRFFLSKFFEKDILEAKEVFATGSIKLIKPILKMPDIPHAMIPLIHIFIF